MITSWWWVVSPSWISSINMHFLQSYSIGFPLGSSCKYCIYIYMQYILKVSLASFGPYDGMPWFSANFGAITPQVLIQHILWQKSQRFSSFSSISILLMVQKSGDNQLRLVVYLSLFIVYRILYIPGGAGTGFQPSTVSLDIQNTSWGSVWLDPKNRPESKHRSPQEVFAWMSSGQAVGKNRIS